MSKAFVLGSLNIDIVLHLDHIVQPSETCKVLETLEFLGGKGTNQAVALAFGSEKSVHLIANVGEKDYDRLKEQLLNLKVDPILTVDSLTGQAIIQVEKSGENAILLIPNANMNWNYEKVYQSLLNHHISHGDYILLQNEVSQDVITRILYNFSHLKLTIVLNPAPFTLEIIQDDVLKYVDVLILNKIEAQQLATVKGIHALQPSEMVKEIFKVLLCSVVIITLGSNGLVLAVKNVPDLEPKVLVFKALKDVCPVDSTGAGDCFIGYFMGSLLQNGSLPEIWDDDSISTVLIPSIKMGIIASGLSTQKKGAISSFPDKDTVLKIYSSLE